ncbi:MAG: hypothetical protein D6785_12745, partial [Planctomycetota bacterium]
SRKQHSLLSQVVLATTAVILFILLSFLGLTLYFVSTSLREYQDYRIGWYTLKLEKSLNQFNNQDLSQIPLQKLVLRMGLEEAKIAILDKKTKKMLAWQMDSSELQALQILLGEKKNILWKGFQVFEVPLHSQRQLVLALPNKTFFPLYRHLFILSFFAILAILVSGAFMIYLLYRIILRPLEDLIVANLGTLEGKPEYLLIPNSIIPDNEIGQIMSQRNRLILKLKEFQEKIEIQNEELRQKQVELESWSRELEKRVEQKTKELKAAEERLLQAEKLAALGKLASGIAHEVNNPLASIAVYAEDIMETLQENRPLSKEEREEFIHSLGIIENQAYRLKELTRKLLNFARETKIQLDEVHLEGVIEETLALFQLKDRGHIQFETHFDPRIPPLITDRSLVQQILMNLLDNAVYAMKGEGRILIRTHLAGSNALIMVEDEGHGIPQEIQSKIFDPFFTTKPIGQGTGLGLSICYGLARKLKGSLDFQSKEGQGSIFTLSLPLEETKVFQHYEKKTDDSNQAKRETICHD